MAAERSRRSNAGSGMTKLIEEAEDEVEKDDFYKTTYGGFEEEECDEDFKSDAEAAEDSFDSDFSDSEVEDDVESGGDDEDGKRKKKKQKVFKPAAQSSSAAPKPKIKKLSIKKVPPLARTSLDKQERMRATTILKGTNVTKQQMTARRHPKLPQMRRLTQQELLAEARITEEKNLASLAQIMQCEEDKKNAKITKVRYQGPIIRFQSVRMPLVAEDGKADANGGYCSRSFLEFTDTKSFPREYFPTSKIRYPKKAVCAVTALPAKYKDPLTGLSYATIDAFKYIRQHRQRLKEQLIAKNELKKKKKSVN